VSFKNVFTYNTAYQPCCIFLSIDNMNIEYWLLILKGPTHLLWYASEPGFWGFMQ